MSGPTSSRVVDRIQWCEGLMTLTLSTSATFVPGQFFNLGLKRGETVLRRSYSAASAPDQPLQFLLSEVKSGELTPGLFELTVGSELLLDQQGLGFFTLNEVPETKHLWLVATGTGLGPYLSMLRAGLLGERFERVNIVHGVRDLAQLAHREELTRAAQGTPGLHYIPLLSGPTPNKTASPLAVSEPSDPLLGRITTAWDDGSLERAAGPFDQDCHMLLCGNPHMIEDMTLRLKSRGFEKHRRRQPGHFNFEKYW